MRLGLKKFRSGLRRVFRRSTRVDGYSLLELVITIMLLSVAIPGIVEMYNTALTNTHTSEMLSIAELLAAEQVEIILAHKARGDGNGYPSIVQAPYSNVNPGAPFTQFTRSVTVQTVNPGAAYEYKLITVTVNHSLINPITLTTIVTDHSGI